MSGRAQRIRGADNSLATVFRKDGSPYWYCAYFDSAGRRRYRTTKERRRSKAVTAAAKMEASARRTLEGDNPTGQRVLAILEEAAEMSARSTLSEASARSLLGRIVEATTGAPLHNPSVEEWFREWLAQKEQSRTETTHLRYEGVIDTFLKYLPESKRAAPLAALSSADIGKFRDKLYREGRTEATSNMAVKILRAPLNTARRQGIILTNPGEAIELIAAPRVEKAVFTPAQVGKLVKAAKDDWQGLILAGYYTGGRIGDLSNLRWSAVDLKGQVIVFSQGKTGCPVTIPIHAELKRWLSKRSKPKDRDANVFPSGAGKTSGGRNGLSGQFRLIMKNAGIKGTVTKARGKKGRNRSSLSFHSFRHSFNSEMANAGIPQEVRQVLTGHASKAINDRYTHAQLDVLRRAVKKVPALPKN